MPHTAIEHQRAVPALLRSMRNSRHSSFAHGRNRPGLFLASASHISTARRASSYEFATGQRLGSGDFEGGKSGAVAVLGKLGFTVQHK